MAVSFSSLRILLTSNPVTIGLLARLLLAWFLPWLLDDGKLLAGVNYTDIDFHVYSDAAQYLRHGGNPFDRVTYRYTPFLAAILALFPHREYGRYLFCVADAICGWIILALRRRNRGKTQQETVERNRANLEDALWWMYNPLAINICTRGSAESFIVLLPVLLTVWITLVAKQYRGSHLWAAAATAGVFHGIAVHAKLYPIIYTVSFATNFTRFKPQPVANERNPSFRIVYFWTRRLLTPAPLIFGFSAVAVFVAITYASVQIYGEIALQEGLLYHFSRVDHRHNYAMHWYWIFLARARGSSDMALAGRVLLLPQLVLLAYTSLGLAPHNLTLALFVQTFLFVNHNKVITAQYFTWYLCLLPLCSDQLKLTRRVKIAVAILLGSVVFWLGSAYCLEMQGMSVFRLVWIASLLFFVANVNLFGALINAVREKNEMITKKRA